MFTAEFVMGSGGVPAGSYHGQFVGTEKFDQNADKYGEGISLQWKVLGGPHEGAMATRICSPKLTPKSTLTKFATALKGAPLAAGERFSFGSFIGTVGMLLVEQTDSGSTRVAAFIREHSTQPQVVPQQTQQPIGQPFLQQTSATWEQNQQQARETF